MSWIDQIEDNISITTGDGKVYEPLYSSAKKDKEYNTATFNFPNITGTLVTRGTPQGRAYTLVLTFQGEDNIDEAKEFEESADDPRAWKISHPIFGNILVQPLSIAIDHDGLNTSVFTIPILETITDDAPVASQDPKDKTDQDIQDQQEVAAEVFANNVDPSPTDLNALTSNTDSIYTEGVKIVNNDDDLNEYFNAFNTANAAIIQGTSDPLTMISTIQTVIMYPSLFQTSVKARLDTFKSQFTSLSESLENLTTPNQKNIYENNAGALIMGMVNTSINPLDASDYGNKVDVLAVVDVLVDYYNQFIANLDVLQTDTGGDPDSYIPNYSSISAINSIVSFAISQLFIIVLDARQERIISLECDDNIINLTHRFYGLEVDDSTIDEFIRNNNIGLSEMLQIKQGRKIVYYI